MSSPEEFRRRRVPTGAWIAAIAGIIVIAVVLVVVLSGGSDDSGGSTNTAAKATTGGGSLTVAALSKTLASITSVRWPRRLIRSRR